MPKRNTPAKQRSWGRSKTKGKGCKLADMVQNAFDCCMSAGLTETVSIDDRTLFCYSPAPDPIDLTNPTQRISEIYIEDDAHVVVRNYFGIVAQADNKPVLAVQRALQSTRYLTRLKGDVLSDVENKTPDNWEVFFLELSEHTDY